VPATLVAGSALARFAAGAAPVLDPPSTAVPAPESSAPETSPDGDA